MLSIMLQDTLNNNHVHCNNQIKQVIEAVVKARVESREGSRTEQDVEDKTRLSPHSLGASAMERCCVHTPVVELSWM